MSSPSDPERLAEAVTRWQGLRVLVLGDALLDDWRHGEPDRLCREAPVPVVSVGRTEYAPGGAANTALNIAALGGQPLLVAPAGDDAEGAWLRHRLADAGVEAYPVVAPGWRTPTKQRVVAGDQVVVRIDDGGAAGLPANAHRSLLALAEAALNPAPAALVLCDYGYGTLSAQMRRWLRDRRAELPFVALDTHDLGRWSELRPNVVSPSFAEAAGLLGAWGADQTDRAALVTARGGDLLDRTGAELAAVTLDADGAVVVSREGAPVRTTARPVPASHTVGAGDAYLAALVLALASGTGRPDAARLAQLAATASIDGARTCVCDRAALLDALPDRPAVLGERVLDQAALSARLTGERGRGGRIVFTNGCFDVLHRGHVGLLEQAKALGDVLVVAVNSDDGVRRLKGPDRPVNAVEDRTVVLASLSCVDYVTVFDEDTPAALIERIRPDVYVKGGDYRAELLSEAALVERLGGEVRILDYLPDRSTSAVIERIRSRAPMGSRR
jgi:rfaE bifunctional protein nucleotidyltransferase chain/domain/rfaE bifunctional protein kinase chain/domain